MLITKEVEVELNPKTITLFENKGYDIPKIMNRRKKLIVKRGTKIIVKVEDLSDKSMVLVDIECDGCGEILENTAWQFYNKYVKEDGKYYCVKCAQNGYKKYTSFYEWCYINLSKEDADLIMLRWDYELNVDKNGKILSPQTTTYGSHGLKERGYWFKCLEHPEHKSEQKRIKDFTNGHVGSITCNQCNSISITHPYLVKYLINKEDALKYTVYANTKIPMKCPECGFEKETSLNTLVSQGFGCNSCGDGISYPEKFVVNVLEQLNKIFKPQLTKTTFKWCGKYKYDNYIEKINCIIETHGNQHYEERTTGRWNKSLKETQENDFDKEWLARINKIKNYIILDCRESDMNWIKNSIMNSKLPQLLDFKEKDIDWLKCNEWACNSMVKEVSNLWNIGIKSTLEIKQRLKLSKSSVVRYLNQGALLGWCDYNGNEERRKRVCKKIICLFNNEIFESITTASNKYNIEDSDISKCCSGKCKSAGIHPDTKEKMVWMYYEEYILKTEGEIIKILSDAQDKKIICLNDGEIFNSTIEASLKYQISPSSISNCCHHRQKSGGIHHITGEKLVWMFYNEHILTI